MEKFKTEKPVISSGVAKKFVEKSCDTSQRFWVQKWLENLVQSNSYPPQICGKDAFSSLHKFLSPEDCQKVLEKIRSEFPN